MGFVEQTLVETDAPESIIRKFLTDNFILGAADDEIGVNDSLMDLGVIDSTGTLELVAFLETGFGVEIVDDELRPENLDSIANMLAFLGRKRGG